MIEFTNTEVAAYYADRAPKVKQSQAREWRGPCPVHHGHDPNFSVNAETGQANCHSQCGRGWDVISLEMDLTGKDFIASKAAVFALVGRPEPDWQERDVEATYDYVDAKGNLLYQVVRKTGKRFMQRRPDPAGGWVWGLGNATPVPFRLTEVLKADFVAIVEGEKDAINLSRLGVTATCNNGGAGNFKTELSHWFIGKRVAIIPDNDAPGRKHALAVALVLKGIATSLRIVELPGLAEKGDVSDFIRSGGTIEKLRAAYGKAQEWTPEWEFSAPVPSVNDKYIRTLEQYLVEVGGPEKFWDFNSQDGVPTPWTRLTKNIAGGMRSNEVYVIGGNQGSGKSSLAMQFIIAAIRKRKGVLLYSMEMHWRDVFQRMASIEARVDLLEYREHQRQRVDSPIYSQMRTALDEALDGLLDLPLLVSTKPSVTADYLLEDMARIRERQKIDLVVVDHMQLMASTGSVRGDYEKFTNISRSLKQAAMELQLPILLVSQTSRSNSSDKRTELEVSDLRGSGAIEEDAATVMLIYPDKEDSERALMDKSFASGPVKTWLKLGKNRYGLQRAYMPLLHYKTYTRFEEMDT